MMDFPIIEEYMIKIVPRIKDIGLVKLNLMFRSNMV